MQIRVFTLASHDGLEKQEEINKFLRSHRILEVRQQYDETRGHWTFAISYLDSQVEPSLTNFKSTADKVDYRTVLAPDVFNVFSRLRVARKQVAKDESVPVYAIFTNKELSLIAALPELSTSQMMKIDGINRGRAEKYGIALLQAFAETPELTNETEELGD